MSAILIGLSAFVFIELLCAPYEVFGWWPPLLRVILFDSDAIRDYEDMNWWQLAAYKVLAGCGKCLAGWLHLFYAAFFDIAVLPYLPLAIFTAWLLEQFKNRIEA